MPVVHHSTAEPPGHNVVHVLFIQRSQDCFHAVAQPSCFEFGWIRQSIHHVGDAAVLECLCDGFPSVLHQFCGVAWLNALINHFIEAQKRPGLEHPAQNGLLAH